MIKTKKKLAKIDWVLAAKKNLIKEGDKGVKVDLLAKKLGITRGSFYWHFKSRQELLHAIIVHWRESNTAPMLEAIKLAGLNGRQEDFKYVDDLWLKGRSFNPNYDAAIRDWARTDKIVATAVYEVDQIRIDAFKVMFIAFGFEPEKALIRARILYFHQVGYYALNIKETLAERRHLSPLYDEVLLY